ncbi:hypothetical protein CQ052_05225 [Ochrobactrum sp. MYb15]|nr:hypothetical protein CQZ90_03665 [Ochrobactrum sp. MYb19]PRA62581.1 hypothetical protein CQ053_17050 [Ochrobactrum sp. MYb18]PRA76765.1 hypothetical protein CQ049_05225 [Brucella thiophenivorans]PRA93601.1 hypothetical protein CQ051_03665 [Ochrobactrum sp. MYb14]PRA98772.1 hypothetical protein CQ052_05225 [Ochrobactrum sp. MYb15]
MKFEVLREHIGDKFYKEGDTRDADELTVKQLVRNGVLRPISDEKASSAASIEQLQGAATAGGSSAPSGSASANSDSDKGAAGDRTGVTTEAGAVQTEALAATSAEDITVTEASGEPALTSNDQKSEGDASQNKAESAAPKNKSK